jgi:NADH-quinone oxidoreductase subunit L
MMIPLFVLAIGAVLAGYLNFPVHKFGDFLGGSPSFSGAYELARARFGEGNVDHAMFGQHPATAEGHGDLGGTLLVMAISTAVAVAGIFAAYVLHLKNRMQAERIAQGLPALTRLLEARYLVDEIYQAAIVEPLRQTGRILFDADRYLVDGAVAAVAWAPQLGGWVLKLGVQRGSLQGYAAAMLFGVVVILVLVFGLS